jgi:hypothetical protein
MEMLIQVGVAAGLPASPDAMAAADENRTKLQVGDE